MNQRHAPIRPARPAGLSRHAAIPARRLARLLRWVLALALLAGGGAARADADALWRLIDTRCVPEALAGQAPEPCAQVSLSPDRGHGWVVLKDRNGRLQYLLMPTARITGIESPELEHPAATDFVAQAWQARGFLDRRNGRPLPRDAVSLAVNSQPRRSQNQLHVHISCVQPELRARLLAAQSEISAAWSPLGGGWLRHAWFVRRVEAPTLDGVDAFADVFAHVPGAAADMGRMTLGVVAATFSDGREGFVLLAAAADPADPTSGSAEADVQDHDCAILAPGR